MSKVLSKFSLVPTDTEKENREKEGGNKKKSVDTAANNRWPT